MSRTIDNLQSGEYHELAIKELDVDTIEAKRILLDSGTVTAPPLSFKLDTDLGFYLPSVGTLGTTVGGTQVIETKSTSHRIMKPMLINYEPGGLQLKLCRNGADTGGVFNIQDNSGIAGTVGSVNDLQVYNQSGGSYIWLRLNGSGGSFHIANIVGTTNTAFRIYGSTGSQHHESFLVNTITSAGAGCGRVRVRCAGDPANPCYGFLQDGTSGFYGVTAGTIGISCSGTGLYTFGPNNAQYLKPLLIDKGSLANPGLGIFGSANTGFYSLTVGELNFGVQGTNVLNLRSDSIETPVAIRCSKVRVVSTSQNLLTTDYIVKAAATITLTMPTMSGNEGLEYYIYNIGGSPVTIQTASGGEVFIGCGGSATSFDILSLCGVHVVVLETVRAMVWASDNPTAIP